ncbi:UNVERIFIED_CONTAM: hypothetical protein NCL1_35882 [Trichonephila clavipes]
MARGLRNYAYNIRINKLKGAKKHLAESKNENIITKLPNIDQTQVTIKKGKSLILKENPPTKRFIASKLGTSSGTVFKISGLIFFCEHRIPLHGDIGEIVLIKPMPNLPICLWGDKNGSIYRKFSMSDYGVLNPFTNGLTICCRRFFNEEVASESKIYFDK